MKIRNGFVSNSSSSSFVLLFRKPNVCSCCGRGDRGFLDFFTEFPDLMRGETSLDRIGKDVLKDIDNHIDSIKEELKEIEAFDDDHVLNTFIVNGDDNIVVTAGKKRTWSQKEIDDLNEKKYKIETALADRKKDDPSWEIMECSISYHDDSFNEKLKEMVKSGDVEVIIQEND